MKTATKIIIALVLLALTAATVWYFRFRKSIEIKNIDWVKGEFDYRIDANGFKAEGHATQGRILLGQEKGGNDRVKWEIVSEGAKGIAVRAIDAKTQKVLIEKMIKPEDKPAA